MKLVAVTLLCAMVAIGLGASATPRPPDSLKLTGYAGALGEWELTAAVTQAPAGGSELSGSLNLKHVGFCSQDGPEEKSGAMRVRLSGPSSAVLASLVIDGVTCTYSGKLSSLHTGLMACPGKRAVPITLWAD